MMKYAKLINSEWLLKIAFAQALVGMLGSLYFSDVLGLAPCTLCWYQRITMYPLVWIIGLGIYLNDLKVTLYALPLALIGTLIAFYHNLLYYDNMFNYGVVPDTIVKCQEGLSCTSQQLNWFGFVTIPLLALIGFLIIDACLLGYNQLSKLESSK